MDKYSNDIVIEQWKRLSNLTKINEKKDNHIIPLLVKYEKGVDGKAYGIIKENNKYFLKISSENKSVLKESDFKYIGGLENKTLERFDSFSHADRRLYGKLSSLKESFNNKYIEEDEEKTIEDELIDDLDSIDNSENKEVVTADPVKPQIDPVNDTVKTEPTDNVEKVEPTEQPVDNSVENTPTDSIEPSKPNDSSETPTDNAEPSEEGDTDSAYSEIQSLLGKLSNEITKINDLSPAQTKNILNTVISSTKNGIEGLSDDEKENLTVRIKKDGKKLEEDLEEEIEVISHNVIDEIPNEESQENVEGEIQPEESEEDEFDFYKDNIQELASKIVNEEIKKINIFDTLKKDVVKMINENSDTILNEDVYGEVEKIIKPFTSDEAKIKELANSILKSITPEERKKVIDYVKSYQLKEDDEFSNHDSIMNSIRKNFKSGSKKSIALVALMLFLKFAGTAQAQAQTSQDNVKDKKNTEVKFDGKSLEQDTDNDEYKLETKSLNDNGKSKIQKITIKGDYKATDKRGENLKNKAVMDKPFEQLDDEKDTEKLEKVWRIIAKNPGKALSDGKVVSEKGKVLATNVKLEGSKVVFDFVFQNEDSQDYKDGKTPVKILGAEVTKAPDKTHEVKKIWVVNTNKGNLVIDPADENHDDKVLQAIKNGYVKQGGTYDWIKPTGGIWVNDGPELKDALKDGARFDYKPFINQYGAKGENVK